MDSSFRALVRGKFGWSRYQRAKREFDRVVKNLRSENIAIDCGANVGDITLKLARNGPRVYAFEPDPLAFEKLKARTAGLEHVTIYQKAVSSEPGEVRLFRGRNFLSDPLGQTVSSSIMAEKTNVDQKNAVEVEQIDLLEFISNLNARVSLLKLDIEGAEFDILEALFDSPVLDLIDKIFVEMHTRTFPQYASRCAAIRHTVKTRFSKKINIDWG